MIRTNHFHARAFAIAICAAVMVSVGCPVDNDPFDPEEGLVHYYPFSGNANDQGSDPKDGVVTGAVLAADRNDTADSAYGFSGTDYITLDFFSPPADFTISVWINTTDSDGGILTYRYLPAAPGTDGEGLCISGSKLNYFRSNGVVNWDIVSVTSVDTGVWLHVAVVKSTSTYRLYINGSPDDSGSDLTVLSINDLTIGYNLSGVIDEVRVYDRALSASDISELSQL